MLDHQRSALSVVPGLYWRVPGATVCDQSSMPPGNRHECQGAVKILHQQSGWSGTAVAFGGTCSLEHRKPPEHGHTAVNIAQPAKSGNKPYSGHPGQTPPCWQDRGISPQSPTQLRYDCFRAAARYQKPRIRTGHANPTPGRIGGHLIRSAPPASAGAEL